MGTGSNLSWAGLWALKDSFQLHISHQHLWLPPASDRASFYLHGHQRDDRATSPTPPWWYRTLGAGFQPHHGGGSSTWCRFGADPQEPAFLFPVNGPRTLPLIINSSSRSSALVPASGSLYSSPAGTIGLMLSVSDNKVCFICPEKGLVRSWGAEPLVSCCRRRAAPAPPRDANPSKIKIFSRNPKKSFQAPDFHNRTCRSTATAGDRRANHPPLNPKSGGSY